MKKIVSFQKSKRMGKYERGEKQNSKKFKNRKYKRFVKIDW